MRTSPFVRVRATLLSVLFFSFVSLVLATPASDLTNKGVSALKSGDYGTATTNLIQALSRETTSNDYNRAKYYLIRSYYDTGDDSTAQKHINDLITGNVAGGYQDGAYYYRMRIGLREKNLSMWSTSFVQLTTSYSNSFWMPAVYLRYAEGYRDLLHDYPTAAQYFKKIVDDYPTDTFCAPVAQLHIAELWMNGNLKDEYGNMSPSRTISEAQKVVDKWPNTEWALQAQNNQCLIHQKMGRRNLTRSIAQSIVSTYTYAQYSTQYIHALYSLSFLDYQDNNWDKAVAGYRALIKNYPTSYLAPEAEKQIARIYYYQGNITGAIQEVQNLINNYSKTSVGLDAPRQLQFLQSKQTTQLVNTNSQEKFTSTKPATVPVSTNNCGPIALRYVLAHYGVSVGVEKLEVASGYTHEGTNFAGLAHAAEANGFQTVGLKTRFEELTHLPLPMIVQLNHRQRDHFIAIYKIDKKHIYFADSAGDQQQVSNTDFQQQWTGYALVISPQVAKKNLRTLVQKNPAAGSLILTQSQMETIMGGQCNPPPPPDDVTFDCANIWMSCPCPNPPIPPGGGQSMGGSVTHSSAPLYGNAGQPSSGISGGAITSVGGGGGNSAVSLAINGGNGWAFTVFPQISIPSIKGGHSLTVYRSYANARSDGPAGGQFYNYGPDKLWGTLWTINYATHLDLELTGDSNSEIYWINEIGDQVLYQVQPADGSYLPANLSDHYAIYNKITVSGSQYTLQFQDGTQYVFDSVSQNYARLAQINFPNNNSVTCQYANPSTYMITSITDPDSRQITFGYTNYKLTSITDPWGRSVLYTYDSNSNLTQIQNPDRYTVNYYYDSNSQITATRDSYSGTTNLYCYSYNGAGGQCTTIMDINGTQTQYNMTIWWYITNIAITNSGTTLKTVSLTYDNKDHNLTNITNADGTNVAYNYDYMQNFPDQYNNNGDLVSIKNQAGKYTNFMVDTTYGYTTAVIDVAGNTTYNIYNNTYNVMTCSVDAYGKRTYYIYDSQRNLLSITDPLGNIIQYAYDSYGNRTSATDALGEVSRFFYNSYSELTMVIKWDNSTTVFFYDTYGNRTAVMDPLGHQTFYRFDTMHRLLSVTDNLGGVTQYAYYMNGLLKSFTDAKQNTTNYTYDLRNRLIKETDAANNSTQCSYNCFDMVTGRQDAKNQKTYYFYDSMNRVTMRSYDNGTTVQFYYDVLGNTTSINDPYIGLTYWKYDILSRVTGYSNPWGSMVYAYDNNNRRTGMIDPDGNLYCYFNDALGRPAVIENGFNQWTQYAYDSIGRKTLEIYPNGVFTAYSYTSCGCGNQILDTLCYQPTDNFNRSSLGSNWTQAVGNWSIQTNQLYIAATSFQMAVYSAGGSVSNPTVECSLDMHMTFSPNVNGFLVFGYSNASNYYYAGANAYGTTFGIGYVSGGTYSNVTKKSYTMIGEYMYRLRVTVSGSTVTLYLLTSSGWQSQLSYIFGSSVPAGYTGVMSAYACTSFDDFILNNSTTVLATNTYTYDLAGNRTQVSESWWNPNAHCYFPSNINYYYDSLNRLTTENRTGWPVPYEWFYNYDSVGNRTQMVYVVGGNYTTITNYGFNNLNQLTSNGSNTYTYDNNGNEITKGSNSLGWNYENLMTSYGNINYLYDSLGQRIWKQNNTNYTRYFFEGINPLMEKGSSNNSTYTTSAVYTLAPGVIKEIISVRKYGTDYYYHYDPIGNVLFVSDTSGNINTDYVQEAFGNVCGSSGSVPNNYHLTTKELDPDIGLYYFSARWYDPNVGRFVSKDLIRYPSRYIYVNNNPINLTDPNGLCTYNPPNFKCPGKPTCEELLDDCLARADFDKCVCEEQCNLKWPKDGFGRRMCLWGCDYVTGPISGMLCYPMYWACKLREVIGKIF